MRILLASSNPHKLREIRAVFGQTVAFELIGLEQLQRQIPQPVEDRQTFEGNAALKAQYYADAAGMHCLADDSGLEVDALGGEPGVRSARYAGAIGAREAVDRAKNQLLLERLGDLPAEQRTARFVCVMALCEPGKTPPVAVVRGTVEGRILTAAECGCGSTSGGLPGGGRGENGFGYDPIFLIPDLGKTAAELTPDQKNAISHRGSAARKMRDRLVRLFPAD